MAFLARCPDCGRFQVSVLDPETAINLKCDACRSVFSPVAPNDPQEDNVNWSLAATMAGYEYEPPRQSKENLVVIRNLPSVYPDQPPPRRIDPNRRRKKRRPARVKNRGITPLPPPDEPVQPPSEVPVVPEPAANPTDQAAADPTAPTPKPDPSIWTTNNTYRLPPPEAFIRPAKRKEVEESEDYGKLELNRISIVALFVLVAGLLLSALTSINYLPLTLIVLSAVLGVFAVRTSLHEGRRLVVPGVTLGVAGVVSIGALFGHIGGGSKGSSTGSLAPSAVSNVQVVPHPLFANDPSVRTAEWTDASKASLLLNGTRVEVVEARSLQSSFSVRIRIRPPAGLPGASGGIDWNSKFPAVLHNGAVARFEQQSATLEAKSVGSSPSEGVVVLIEFPAVSVNYGLRLEVPAAAWGATGTMRFAIPRSMLKK